MARLRRSWTRSVVLALATASASWLSAPAQADDAATDSEKVFDAHLVGGRNCAPSCGPKACDLAPGEAAMFPEPSAPEDVFMASAAQGPLLAQSRVPAMIGDFFGAVVGTSTAAAEDEFGNLAFISTSGVAGFQTGRQKIVENTSPMPQDRAYFNYSFYDNVGLVPGGMPINRFTPGFEKTFADGNMSFEVRFPFASTIDSDIVTDSDSGTVFDPNTNQIEFGNVTLYFKALLHATETYAISTGLGISLPTANDQRVLDLAEEALLEVRNESVHLLPFIGGIYTPNDRFFAQWFLQVDVDANGNPVYASGGTAPGEDNTFNSGLREVPRTQVGTVNDQTYLYFDIGVGYWVYRNQCCDAFLTGVAPRFELHYNSSVSDPDVVSFDRGTSDDPTGLGFAGQVASGLGDFDALNLLLGSTFELRHDSTVTMAYVIPVGNGADQVFDGELRLLLNYFFGPSRRFVPFAR